GSDVATPGTREVLVKGAEGAGWLDCLTSAANDSRQQCSDELTLRTGDRLTRPFGATMHPGARQAWHREESVFVSVGVSDGLHRGTMGLNTVAQSRLELQTPDGATVGTADGTYAYFRGVEEAGRYRLVQELEMVPGGLSSMTGARTVWEF